MMSEAEPIQQAESEAAGNITSRFAMLLVVVLPLLSYPLSWLPHAWAQARYNVGLPIAALSLVVALLWVAWRLAKAVQSEPCSKTVPSILSHEQHGRGAAAMSAPASKGKGQGEGPMRLVLVCLFALVVSWLISIRFSQQPAFSVMMLPALATNLVMVGLGWQFTQERLASLFGWWLVAALIVAANGLVRLGSEPEFLSTFGNRNFLGAYLAASIVLALGVNHRWAKLGVAVLLAALVLCQSRSAWLGLALVGALLLLVKLPAGWRPLAWVGLGVAAAVVALSTAMLWPSDVRPLIWRGAVQMVADQPLVGHGLGTFVAQYPAYRPREYFLLPKAAPVTDHAHNEWLEVAAEQGVLGWAATAVLWVVALVCGARARQWVLVGALGVLMVHGLLDVGLRYAPNQQLFWLLLGLSFGTAKSAAQAVPWRLRYRPARLVAAAACIVLAVIILRGSVVDRLRADIWDRQARLAELRGDYEQAAVAAAQALDCQPHRLSTRYFLAGVLARLPMPEAQQQAIRQAEQVRELAADYADINYNLGALYLIGGQPAQAIPLLRRALELNPFDGRPLPALRRAQAAVDNRASGRQSAD